MICSNDKKKKIQDFTQKTTGNNPMSLENEFPSKPIASQTAVLKMPESGGQSGTYMYSGCEKWLLRISMH